VPAFPPDSVATAYLTTPPEACVPGPIVTRPQLLNLSSLAPRDFERLCFRLTRTLGSVQQVHIYGVPGQGQEGIDLYARRVDGTYVVVQCKRRSDKLTVAEITKAVDTFLAGHWAGQAKEFVLAVTAGLDRAEHTDQIEVERKKLAKRDITFTVWDEGELSALLKDHPRVVDDFFGRQTVTDFLGEDESRKLGDRLDAADMVAYRRQLGTLYREVFHSQERGTYSGERSSPLDERFVLPDVEAGVTLSQPFQAVVTAEDQGPVADFSPPAILRSSSAVDPSAAVIGSASPASVTQPAPFHDRVDTLDWLGSGTRHLVIGVPGAGKSALLRMLVMDILADDPVLVARLDRFHDVLPVWLPFAFWTAAARKDRDCGSVMGALRHWLKVQDHDELWLVVPTDVSLAVGTVDSMATAAKSRVAEGFDVLKVKVGTDAATDINRVTAVRQAVGPEVRIRLDANQG
jgi:hypothetical protein